MAVNDRDLGAFEYLAERIREDTPGCAIWDRQGTHVVFARELKGKHLVTALEMILAHAVDPNAKTPAAITRKFTPDVPKPSQHARPLRRDNTCLDCGRHLEDCVCGGRTRVYKRGDATTGAEAVRAGLGACPDCGSRNGYAQRPGLWHCFRCGQSYGETPAPESQPESTSTPRSDS